ncbi:MAG: cob(I)yrinic acid a,c-diamide adenosyltransferase, partial [bacterium]
TSTYLRMLGCQSALELIKSKPRNLELILTGRGALPELIELADLVTEMRPLKHYYQKGVTAREGVDF